jgi:hypothetical protein
MTVTVADDLDLGKIAASGQCFRAAAQEKLLRG